jgi:hypothetical protein
MGNPSKLKRASATKKKTEEDQLRRRWELPHPIELSPLQKNFLSSHFGPGVNVDPKTLPPESRRQIEYRSPLAKRRLQDPEWLKKNLNLYKKALSCDERAFQELVSRDPRYLCSDLGLFFIASWHAAIDISRAVKQTNEGIFELKRWIDWVESENQRVFSFITADLNFEYKLNDLIHPAAEDAEEQISQLSNGLLSPFVRKGIRSSPPQSYIHAFYHASVILFSGLKRATKNVRTQGEKIRRIERRLEHIVMLPDDQIRSETQDGFLLYIRAAACLFMGISKNEKQQKLQSTISFDKTNSTRFTVYSILINSPARLAEAFVGRLFGIKGRTVAKHSKSPFLITWPSMTRNAKISATKLKERLEDYEPLREILCNKS